MIFNNRLVILVLGSLALCGFLWAVSGSAGKRMKKGSRSAQPASSTAPAPQAQAVPAQEGAAPSSSGSAWGEGGDPVAFKKPEEVRALLGSPDAEREQEDRVVWYYHREVSGWQGQPLCAEIHFMGGEVRANVHYPCEMMPDKIATARLVPRPRQVPARTQRFSQEEFDAKVIGKTKAQVREALGEPEILHIIQGKEVWQYQGIVQFPDGGLISYAIVFEGEAVSHIQGG